MDRRRGLPVSAIVPGRRAAGTAARPVAGESPFSQPAYQPKVTAPEPAPVADVATARVRTPGAAP